MELTNIRKKFLKEMELYATQEEIEALDMIFFFCSN